MSNASFSRPASRTSGDWSAHIATTLDRLADTLDRLDDEQWEAPSMCSEWRVRDVAGHLIWRLGLNSSDMVGSAFASIGRKGFNFNRIVAQLARDEAAAPTPVLVEQLREIASSKLAGDHRNGIIELTEAVVHAYDVTEALGLQLRLSPRSTGSVALARTKMPFGGKAVKLASKRSLRATDARWQIGSGPTLDATAGEIIMHLFDRRRLAAS
ncbi:maleylpyruvate isomerase family mycothiol-dependent enzyme [Gulosibacter sp. ACHW.36C]|uniref:Maleylpyruvate isomerase family mycothiol-dependent enzyme n=1 Tax=Gulosibacter sediminis TaxID=1729695 RepID=A0ABY4MZT2_9MICO|nr:maleylpyruvate isomerase family mycothiol-dependent enzyme [Gulosibacter sediminis]UQN15947.1 maleylpyruvate isomerase family mycothiol-dependent enzyme [Gulosibacter sediminis]